MGFLQGVHTLDDEIEHATNPRLSGYAVKTGSYSLERHLIGGKRLVPGCWVNGKTVYGDIRIGSSAWATYTRPVFAYLSAVDTLRLNGLSNQRHAITFAQGHSKQFIREVDAPYSVSSAIERVNILSSLHTGFVDDIAWGAPNDNRLTLLLPGSGVFAIYQMNLVYAHCATSAGQLSKAFRTSKTLATQGRTDLYFLSAISTAVYVAVADAAATPPIAWDALQRKVLTEGYEVECNAGAWSFDFSASQKIHYKY